MSRAQEKDSLKRRYAYLAPLALVSVVVLTVLYSLTVYFTLSSSAERENLAANLAQAEIAALLVADHQESLRARLMAIASRNVTREALLQRNLPEVSALMRPLAEHSNEVKSVFVANPAGQVLVQEPESAVLTAPAARVALAAFLPLSDPSPFLSPVHAWPGPRDEKVVTLSVPVRDRTGRLIGFLGLLQRAAMWQTRFQNFKSRPGRVYRLFDQDGGLVAAGPAENQSGGAELGTLVKMAAQHLPPGQESAAWLGELPPREQKFFVAAARVPGPHWLMVVTHDYWLSTTPTRLLLRNLLGFLAVACLFLGFLGYLLASRNRVQQKMLTSLDDEARRLEATVAARTSDLQSSTERLTSLLTDLPDIVYELDHEARLTFVSQAVDMVLGYSPAELVGRRWRDLVLDEDRPAFDEERARISEDQLLAITALRYRCHDGQVRWLSIRSRARRDPAGQLIGRRGVARDVTSQVLAEQRVRELSGRIIQAQEEERRRLALDLHDELGQLLMALKIGLQALIVKGEQNPQEVSKLVQLNQRITDRVRALAYQLRPAVLDSFGLVAAVEDLCESFAESDLIAVEHQLDDLDESDLSAELKLSLFRFVQEALTNAVRHSGSSLVRVFLHRRDPHLEISVADCGHGFDPEEAFRQGKHLGLLGMKERLSLLGGILTITSTPQGSTVTAKVPLLGD
ncbi:MAG: PAS domain S-box protein [Deltaproteobacteria bacterium]|nr:PAS domain S-box protein [Deltaproteobacteria bacterium]